VLVSTVSGDRKVSVGYLNVSIVCNGRNYSQKKTQQITDRFDELVIRRDVDDSHRGTEVVKH